jgi:hypothetical protein
VEVTARKGTAKAPARCSNHPACSGRPVAALTLASGDVVRYCSLCFEEWLTEEVQNMEQGDRHSLLCERPRDGFAPAVYKVGN